MLRFCLRLLLALAALSLVGGCAFPRHDAEPKTLVDPGLIALAPDLAPIGKGWPEAEWWRGYGDAQLNRLVELALAGSPSLDVAVQRSDVALARAELAWADQLPMVGLSGDIDRQHVSKEGFLGLFADDLPLLGLTGPWYTSGTVGLTGAWELDIWGKKRDMVRAALGAHKAALSEEAQARLTIATAVARMYWGMETMMSLRGVLAEARDIEALALSAEKRRYAEGLVSRTEADLAQARVEKLEEQLAALNGNILMAREGLKAMLGLETPLPEIAPAPLPEPADRLPERLGYELLVRRPDLQAARWYIEASLGEVEAAKAAFYPSFNLMAFLGFDSLHLDSLFTKPAEQVNVLMGVSLPIFDGGRLNANLKAARSESDLSIAAYNEAVAGAVSEVGRNAALMQSLGRQNLRRQKALDGLTKAWRAAQAQYKNGLIDRVAAARAKLPLLLDKAQGVELRGRWLEAEVNLIKALGGGYRAAPYSPAPEKADGPADPFLERELKF